jgi:hypothetical protein
MLRNSILPPWSCKAMCPVGWLAHRFSFFHLLAAMRLFQSSLPISQSTTLTPCYGYCSARWSNELSSPSTIKTGLSEARPYS